MLAAHPGTESTSKSLRNFQVLAEQPNERNNEGRADVVSPALALGTLLHREQDSDARPQHHRREDDEAEYSNRGERALHK
jgi:hypothetical protein